MDLLPTYASRFEVVGKDAINLMRDEILANSIQENVFEAEFSFVLGYIQLLKSCNKL